MRTPAHGLIRWEMLVMEGASITEKEFMRVRQVVIEDGEGGLLETRPIKEWSFLFLF